MFYDAELEATHAPLFGIGGLLGITMMALLLVGFPEVRWFAVLSIPLGIVMAAGMRAWRYLEYRRERQLIWIRNAPHFHWPHPIN